jgi:hypothetical protein
MEIIREQNRIRKQNERERKRLLSVTRDVTQNVAQCHATDKEEDKEKEKRKINKKKSFENEFVYDDVDLEELKIKMFQGGSK